MNIHETSMTYKKLKEAGFPFAEYVPLGTWIGRLDQICYPRSHVAGVHVFLTEDQTKSKYHLFQYWYGGCEPHTVLREAHLGQLVQVTVGRSRNGRPKITEAKAL
jgi:hypothetical protein